MGGAARPPWWKIVLVWLWALPITLLAVLACITVIGIPIGILLLFIGCYPLTKLVRDYIDETVEWEYRDHALPTDEPKPWEEE